MDRHRQTPEVFLNKTVKPSPNSKQGSRVSYAEVSIASIIQEKVANLKHKFGELDDMRRKLIESRCESREETDSKLSTLNHSRARSGDSSCETYSNDLFKSRNDSCYSQTFSQDRYEKELHNERKSTQKAILEKSLIERESQEKFRHLNFQLTSQQKELENLSERLKLSEKRNHELEEQRKKNQSDLETQAETIHSLNEQLLSSNQAIKKLTKQIGTLEKSLRSAKESTSSATVKNLSNIILSKDSPTKVESTSTQLINKYMEALQDLQSADQFTIYVIQKLENNNLRKAQKELIQNKPDVLKRMQKTNFSIEELERYVFDCRSPSTFNRSSLVEFIDSASDNSEIEKNDYFAWIKCQAAVVEDLLLISDMGK
jgi:uncharacterized coiled-coil protein SlyX